MSATLCLDAGTSRVKAVAYDAGGEPVAEAAEDVPVSRPRPGWAEQDMAGVWRSAARALRRVAAAVDGDADAIAFTGQGDGCWLVDAAGTPTGPAILWSDGRAAPIVEAWSASGVLAAAFQDSGTLTFPGLANAILAWLREHDRERLDRSRRALTADGWLFHQLTGDVAVDESDASAPFLDLRTREYSPSLLRRFELEWAHELLPPVRHGVPVGALRAAAADELGLRAGLPVVMAPYDIVATALGAGVTAPEQCCSILGTTLCTEVVVDEPARGPAAGLTVAFGLPDRWVRGFATLAGTEVIDWAVALLGLRAPAELGTLAAAVPAGAGGLALLPYLSPAGERAPFLDAAARGALLGLTVEHGRGHLARAVLEALSFVIRDCLGAATSTPAELRLCGGGAASDAWTRLIADVCGIPVVRTADSEVGARGAYLVSLVATGRAPDLETAARDHVRVRDVHEPDARDGAQYEELYEQMLDLRRGARPLWERMAGG